MERDFPVLPSLTCDVRFTISLSRYFLEKEEEMALKTIWLSPQRREHKLQPNESHSNRNKELTNLNRGIVKSAII